MVALPASSSSSEKPGALPTLDLQTTKQIAVGVIVPMAWATIFILARCYSRTVLIKNWGWDDSLIVVAWLCSLVKSILEMLNTLSTILAPVARSFILSQMLLYQFCVSITKLSIICAYLRIVSSGKYRILSWATLILALCISSVLVVMSALVCDNVGRPLAPGATRCFAFLHIVHFSAAFHCTVDAWLVALIVPFIGKLSIPKPQKVALSALLSLGVIVIIANVVRTIAVSKNNNLFVLAVATSVELNLGLFCASAPATLPLWRKLSPALMGRVMGPHSYFPRAVASHTSRMRARAEVFHLSSQEGSADLEVESGGPRTENGGSTDRTSSITQSWPQPRGERRVNASKTDWRGSSRMVLDDVASEDSSEGVSRRASRSAGEEVVSPLSPSREKNGSPE